MKVRHRKHAALAEMRRARRAQRLRLIDELQAYPEGSRHDDMLDAMSYVIAHAFSLPPELVSAGPPLHPLPRDLAHLAVWPMQAVKTDPRPAGLRSAASSAGRSSP